MKACGFFAVDYRGEKIAAFMIGGKTMLCLPQAFELFLKNLGRHFQLSTAQHYCNFEFYIFWGGCGGSVLGAQTSLVLGSILASPTSLLRRYL
jgi:hypothetical protein